MKKSFHLLFITVVFAISVMSMGCSTEDDVLPDPDNPTVVNNPSNDAVEGSWRVDSIKYAPAGSPMTAALQDGNHHSDEGTYGYYLFTDTHISLKTVNNTVIATHDFQYPVSMPGDVDNTSLLYNNQYWYVNVDASGTIQLSNYYEWEMASQQIDFKIVYLHRV